MRQHSTNGVFINKIQIIEILRSKHKNVDTYDMEGIINTLISLIVTEVSLGSEINIAGLGNFHAMPTKAKQVRNPRTGEKLTYPAGRKIKFIPSLNFKREVNENNREKA